MIGIMNDAQDRKGGVYSKEKGLCYRIADPLPKAVRSS